MKHTRMLAGLLAALLMLSAAGCSEQVESSDPNETAAAPVQAPAELPAETETETSYLDTLPVMDFEGRLFQIGADTGYRLSPEELTGETINDAVYKQMTGTEERYNTDIEVIGVNSGLVKHSISAGDDAYQIVTGGTSGFASGYVLTSMVQNLYKFDQIDLSKPWWNQNSVRELTLNGKLYMAFGDFACERGITYTHSFYFNKALGEEFNLNENIEDLYGEKNMYELVRSGKWTIDALESLIAGVYVDVDGDGDVKKDFDDLYGLGQSIPVSGVYRTAFDCLIMARDEEGWPVLDINTDKFNAIVPRIYALCFENPSVLEGEHAEEGILGDTFVAGRLMIYSGFLCDVAKLREMKDEFGVLPFPKYDEQQTDYFTTVRGDNYFLGIPVTVSEADRDFVGLVTETIACYGYTDVRPAVYDDTLKGKMTRDEDSVQMLDILVDGIVVEFAFAHANDSSFSYVLWNVLNTRSDSFASYYQKKLKPANKYYEKVNNVYKSLED